MTQHQHDPSNKIHPTAIIEGDVRLGRDNVIDAYTVLRGPISIGDGNRIGPHAVIGTEPQDVTGTEPVDPEQWIRIGDRNVIREFTAIQKPVYRAETRLGSDVYLMQSVHIPHDAELEDGVVITPMVALAGITNILTQTNIGMGASVHQKTTIGPYAMIATGAAVVKDVPPFGLFIPGRPLGINRHAVKRRGFEHVADQIEAFIADRTVPTDEVLRGLVDHYEETRRPFGRPEAS